MIIIRNIQLPFLINSIENHAEIKPKIMDSIKSMGIHSQIEDDVQIANTDWYLNPSLPRKYSMHFKPVMDETIKNISKIYGYKKDLTLQNFWFQQYEKGNFHDWHIHGNSSFANVYYVELPDNASKTTFLLNDKEFEIEVKEGDVLTFPSFLMHRSKPSQSEKTKTVIAFNI